MSDFETVSRKAFFPSASQYPRVLLITSSTFNPYTGTGILLTNLFRGWPPEKIALVHSDRFYHDRSACSMTYMLSSNERKWVWPLAVLDRKLRDISQPRNVNRSVDKHFERRAAINNIAKQIYTRLTDIAGGEEIFRQMRVSKQLLEWIRVFDPEVIYSHISSLNNINFNLRMQSELEVPLCIHIMDDWLPVRYRKGLFSPILRRLFIKRFKELLDRATLRIGISTQMCRAYEEEYGRPFTSFYNALDLNKWMSGLASRGTQSGCLRIVYAGTINTKNLNNLASLRRVVQRLNSRGIGVRLCIYTFHPRTEKYKRILESPPIVLVGEVPDSDMGMASLLANADLLFLPVDFTKISIERMRYSMFAKVPAYMASGTPILAYGPPEVAVIEYAMMEKWAYVVPKQDESALEAAILDLASNRQLRASIGKRAERVAIRDFDINKIRPEFHMALARAASQAN